MSPLRASSAIIAASYSWAWRQAFSPSPASGATWKQDSQSVSLLAVDVSGGSVTPLLVPLPLPVSLPLLHLLLLLPSPGVVVLGLVLGSPSSKCSSICLLKLLFAWGAACWSVCPVVALCGLDEAAGSVGASFGLQLQLGVVGPGAQACCRSVLLAVWKEEPEQQQLLLQPSWWPRPAQLHASCCCCCCCKRCWLSLAATLLAVDNSTIPPESPVMVRWGRARQLGHWPGMCGSQMLLQLEGESPAMESPVMVRWGRARQLGHWPGSSQVLLLLLQLTGGSAVSMESPVMVRWGRARQLGHWPGSSQVLLLLLQLTGGSAVSLDSPVKVRWGRARQLGHWPGSSHTLLTLLQLTGREPTATAEASAPSATASPRAATSFGAVATSLSCAATSSGAATLLSCRAATTCNAALLLEASPSKQQCLPLWLDRGPALPPASGRTTQAWKPRSAKEGKLEVSFTKEGGGGTELGNRSWNCCSGWCSRGWGTSTGSSPCCCFCCCCCNCGVPVPDADSWCVLIVAALAFPESGSEPCRLASCEARCCPCCR